MLLLLLLAAGCSTLAAPGMRRFIACHFSSLSSGLLLMTDCCSFIGTKRGCAAYGAEAALAHMLSISLCAGACGIGSRGDRRLIRIALLYGQNR